MWAGARRSCAGDMGRFMVLCVRCFEQPVYPAASLRMLYHSILPSDSRGPSVEYQVDGFITRTQTKKTDRLLTWTPTKKACNVQPSSSCVDDENKSALLVLLFECMMT